MHRTLFRGQNIICDALVYTCSTCYWLYGKLSTKSWRFGVPLWISDILCAILRIHTCQIHVRVHEKFEKEIRMSTSATGTCNLTCPGITLYKMDKMKDCH